MATMWMGVLALEPVAGALPQRQMLTRATAEGLAAAMGAQLGRFLPPEHDYGFVWSAALYDPAQLLRRGFTLHQELSNLFVAGQRQGIAAGHSLTLCERDGKMPTALLVPELAIGGGTLYTIPVVVTGSELAITAAAERLESELYGEGLADAAIVIELARDLGLSFEHVRWLSLLDLSAMMAAQLDHVGFGFAWQLVEEVLYGDPPGSIELTTPQGQLLKLDDEAVWLDFQPYSLFARLHPQLGEHRLAQYIAKLHEFRQLQGLLAAHGIAVRVRLPNTETAHACSRHSDDFVVESIAEGVPAAAMLHEAPGLGALAFTLVDGSGRMIEHRYPLSAQAIGRFRREATDRGWPIERLGRVMLSTDGEDLALPESPDLRH
jgi:hypothetical protein